VIFESFQSAETCPSHSDLLNSLVREGVMAVAVFRSMTLEILSGPDVFREWRTAGEELHPS